MKYFKTVGGMLEHTFAERGMTDDKGNPIVATEKPINEQEYSGYRKEKLERKIKGFAVKETVFLCPKCTLPLDVETNPEIHYPLVCKSCDENFYSIEAIRG